MWDIPLCLIFILLSLSSPPLFSPSVTTDFAIMALLLENDSSPLQKFMAKNEKPLSSMPVHVCPETGGGYIQWSDIQFTFVGIDHLEY